jgi:predicted DCC family thiol-disulfide oxidoreductase YuxK
LSTKIQIVYDKQCPACSKYCELVQSSADPETVNLIDARDESDLMVEITGRGLDIDEGMVVAVEGQLHYGAEAIHALAEMDSGRGLFNRANRLLFKNRHVARILYPCMRGVRNLLLKLLGVGRINNLAVIGRDKF